MKITGLLELTRHTILLEFTGLTALQTSMRCTGLLQLTESNVLSGTLNLTGLLGTLQTGLHMILDFKGLLETLKTGSPATLHFTGLQWTLHFYWQSQALRSYKKQHLTGLRATKEFTFL